MINDMEIQFSEIIESVYNLPLEDRLELKNLLEHNISEARRDEIAFNMKTAHEEYISGQLKFSSDINELKQML